jgi:putative tryptophan/tyrosine transport system substrate-binding protein
MRRREFIMMLGGAAVAWPLAAGAQQPERLRRIGVLMPYAENDADSQVRVRVFEQTLQQLGWTDGRNVRIDYRWTSGDADDVRRLAKELVRLGPDVIIGQTTPSARALGQETSTIPIVRSPIRFVRASSRPWRVPEATSPDSPCTSPPWAQSGWKC